MVEISKPRPYIGCPPLVLFGVAGHPEAFQLAYEFLSGATDQLELGVDDDTVAEVLMASATGVWLWSGNRPIPLISGAKAAIGVGAKAALGAMFVGATATRACEVACAICSQCADPVQSFTLPQQALPPDVAEPIELHEAQDREHDEQRSDQAGDGRADGQGEAERQPGEGEASTAD
jgi:hypothetical protein